MELAAIIDMDDLRKALCRPGEPNRPIRQPLGLRQHRMRNRQGRGCRRGRLKRQIKAKHHARVHVQNKCQPGAPNTGAGDIINQHDIDLGVVDLDDLQGPLCPQPNIHQPETVTGGLGALPRRHALPQTARRNPCAQRLHRRRLEPGRATVSSNLSEDYLESRLLPLEVDLIDRSFDLGIDFSVEPPITVLGARCSGQQRRCYRLLAKSVQEPINSTVAQPELTRRIGDQVQRKTPKPG